MLDVLQLKHSVNRMHLDKVRATVNELQLEGIVTEGKT
ncbi:MAG: transcriptional regulator, partial [Pseudomonas sp.]|nr:transcriptional regulator [Pseudomonas sp.]